MLEFNYQSLLKESKDASDFITKLFEAERLQGQNLSVRSFSRSLNFSNPSLVNDVITKKKKPSFKLVHSIIEDRGLSHSEEKYLINLFECEKLIKSSDLVELENETISKYWDSVLETEKDGDISARDLILSTVIGHQRVGLSEEEVYSRIIFFMSRLEVSTSLKLLIKKRLIKKVGSLYCIDNSNLARVKLKTHHFIDHYQMLIKVANLRNKKQQLSSFSFYTDQDTYNEIKKINLDALEKVALLAQKSNSLKDQIKTTKLCSHSLSFMSLDLSDDW